MKRYVAPPSFGRQTVKLGPTATSVPGVVGLGRLVGGKPKNNGIDTGVRVRRGRR